MDLLINALNKNEDGLNSTIASVLKKFSVHTVEDLNSTVIANKLNKNAWAKIVNDVVKLMNSYLRICMSAAFFSFPRRYELHTLYSPIHLFLTGVDSAFAMKGNLLRNLS